MQEILQTFGEPEKFVAEISLCPVYDCPGLFQIVASKAEGEKTVLYQRKMKRSETAQTEDFYFDGFPDSKFVKVLIRNHFFPEEKLGHVDGHVAQLVDGVRGSLISEESSEGITSEKGKEEGKCEGKRDCVDCKNA